MTQIDDPTRVRYMLDAARHVHELIEGRIRQDLDTDYVLGLALVRLLEILGEATRGVSPDLRARYPDVPWRQIFGLRNRVIHAYFNVDFDIVWRVGTKELEPLVARLESATRAEGWA
ncbi:MAG: HepT-like ribonuclease domain-containing protein [Chloroflexota bacterium]